MFDKDNKFGFINNNNESNNNNLEGLDNIKTDINNIKSDVDKLNTQYKDIVNKVENGNICNNVEPELMDMPRIYFSEGTLPTTKTSTTMRFDYYSKTHEEHGYVDIKCQGSSSMSYNKKNFTIKLYKEQEKTNNLKMNFKNWGKQSKFVLKANWIDITHARNIVCARIWSNIVKSRTNYNNLPELLKTSPNQGVIDGFPVLVFANGIYQGRYTLNIPKDKWTFNMDDSLSTHCILQGENYISGCFRKTTNIAGGGINGDGWSDELHDIVPETIKTRWNECINFVMNSSDEEFKNNLNTYFDLESLIDYLIYHIVICGLDAFGKNQIYLTYDGIKWIASSYDMDSTWGLYSDGSKFVEYNYSRKQFEDYNGNGNLLYIRLQELFISSIKNRYNYLRKNILSVSNMINEFEKFVQVCPKDIIEEDYAITTGEGNFTRIPLVDANNIQQIRKYIVDRLNYCDDYISSLTNPIKCTKISFDTTQLNITSYDSQKLAINVTPSNTTDDIIWSVSPDGICSIDKEGNIKAIKNGNCMITATCGTQTATCNIIVNINSISFIKYTCDTSIDKSPTFLPNKWNIGDFELIYIYKNTDESITKQINVKKSDINVNNYIASLSSSKLSEFTNLTEGIWNVEIKEVSGYYNIQQFNNINENIRSLSYFDGTSLINMPLFKNTSIVTLPNILFTGGSLDSVLASSSITSYDNQIQADNVITALKFFQGNKSLTNIVATLPVVQKINDFCSGCTELIEVELTTSEKLQNLSGAFYGCTKLKTITISDISGITSADVITTNCTSLNLIKIKKGTVDSLNLLFNKLNNNAASNCTIDISECSEDVKNGCNKTIATSKGWTVKETA